MDKHKSLNLIKSVIRNLDRNGNSPVLSKNPVAAEFRYVSITSEEAIFIKNWVIKENAAKTIEIGLAYGFSALHICEGLVTNGNPNLKHVIIDPWQVSPKGYAHAGLDNLKKAGLKSIIKFYGEKSQIVLPRLLKQNKQFDLAFIDGNHLFDYVFLDLFYLGQLIKKGGIIILDDYNFPGINKALSFFINNLNWKVEETSNDDKHHWAVIRTSKEEDNRNYLYFKEF